VTNANHETLAGAPGSNLGMAESKSDHFSFEINAHSEKNAKFDPLSTNRLAVDSECGHTTNIRHPPDLLPCPVLSFSLPRSKLLVGLTR
jgi:hypothetical protein